MSGIPPTEARYRLPLFPLPVVLSPRTPMPLLIFEPRYRAMVRDCLEGDGRFGMVYHDWDRQGPFLSEEGSVGFVAVIREHQGLNDGRSLLVVEGTERFRIVDGIESIAPYFEALVAPYVDFPSDPEELAARRARTIRLFHAVVASLAERPRQLPELESDEDVSFLIAQTVQADPTWHQHLLELRDEGERLALLDALFRAML